MKTSWLIVWQTYRLKFVGINRLRDLHTWSLWLMLSHITTWHERLPRARSFLCYSSLKPKISPSNTLRFPGSPLLRSAFHSFLFPQDWLMIIQGSGLIFCQLSPSYPLPALDWTLRHLPAICQSHTDRLTDNGSLTQSLGTATFLN